MENEVILGNVMVDCDDEKKLQKFYGELLGWEMCELFARPAVRCSLKKLRIFALYGPKKQGNNRNRYILIFKLIMLWKWLRKQSGWEQQSQKHNLAEVIL